MRIIIELRHRISSETKKADGHTQMDVCDGSRSNLGMSRMRPPLSTDPCVSISPIDSIEIDRGRTGQCSIR